MIFGCHDNWQFHSLANFQVLVTSFVTASTSTILQHQYFRSSEEYLQTDMAFALDMALTWCREKEECSGTTNVANRSDKHSYTPLPLVQTRNGQIKKNREILQDQMFGCALEQIWFSRASGNSLKFLQNEEEPPDRMSFALFLSCLFQEITMHRWEKIPLMQNHDY